MEAEHYSKMVSGSDGSSWQVVQSNGQHGDTMKAYPNNTASTAENGAKLVYNVYAKKAGTFNGILYREPTLNEGSEANGTARSCNVQISANGTGAQTLEGNYTYIYDNTYNNPANVWSKNVMRMYEPLNFKVTLNQGWNTIELTRLDPSIVVDRMVICTEATEEQVLSLLGPVESPNNIASGSAVQNVKVAALPKDMADVDIHANMTLTTADSQTAYTDAENIQSAKSGDERTVTVAVKDGKIMVTPKRAGITQITATDANGKTFSFTVTVNPATPGGGVYQEADGKVVIDAADALENSGEAFATSQSGKDWKLKDIGIQAQPDTGDNWTKPENLLNGPSVTYKVNITKADNYYLYVNTSNPDVNADSYHVVVDDQTPYTHTGVNMIGKETWYKQGTAMNLSAGVHTITVYAREDGFTLNQLVLSNNNAENLKGLQVTSKRGAAAPTITVDTLSDIKLNLNSEPQTVDVNASASNQKAVTLKAVSNKEDVATVSVTGDKITVTPVSAGTAVITVTASAEDCANVTKTFTVKVVDPNAVSKSYGEIDGKIVINAVDALEEDTDYASHDNSSATYTNRNVHWAPAENRKSIQLMPIATANDKITWTQTSDLEGKVPSITFKINVEQEGDYYLSVFSNSPTAENDSFHVYLNDQRQFVSKEVSRNGTATGDTVGEGWFYLDKNDTKLHLNEGDNTLTIYGRESGTLLRQLVLSTDKQTNLSDWLDSTLK